MKKSKKFALTLVSLLALTLTACGGGGDTDDSGGGSGGGSANGENTLVVGMDSDLKTMDPARGYEVYGNMMYYAMYDYLYKTYESSTPEPSLAESHELDDTQTVHTFKIKKDVKFSSGNPLTSKDVAFSINRTKNLKSNTSHHTENVKSVETPDDHTVVITLNEPDAAFLVKLANNAFAIVDSEVVKEHGGTDAEDASSADTAEEWLNQNSAGSGAYVLSEWKQNVEVVLEKNENYWGEVKNDKVICKEIPDVNTQIQNVKQGDIDIALGVGVDNASQLEDQDGVDLKSYTGTTTTFLLMNDDPEIGKEMADPKVQEAVRRAINYKELLEICGDGAVLPLNIVPKGFTGALEKAKDYQDVDKAKQLMEEAGYKDGFDVKFTVPNFDTEGMSWTTMGQKIKDDLSKIGINAKIETAEIGVAIDSYREGKEQFLFMHWHPDFPDINNQLAFLPGETVGERAKWSDPSDGKLDELKKTVQTESDEEKRVAASEELQKLLDQQMPFALLVQHPKVLAYRSNLDGVNYYEVQKINFQDIAVK
ncbi:peptide ABC transporter substrate-binding protein [Enterococcus florum]|uniref:Peptide ABC transporter substrate-binding protein n=1 Tax=Enterococcus florum TaxID=2480627 RepID=A0A4P5PR30_9ENTE|nr:ABC transporter substrate-binding protein [Enterococcus florum]GCF95343.1 peptide ABC transporter substrate-binding protein [Enterococcus florum]